MTPGSGTVHGFAASCRDPGVISASSRRLALRLTPRELDVLAAMAREGSRKAAAHSLGIAEQTVANLLGDVYGKLGADGVLHACRLLGWLQIPGTPAALRHPVALLDDAERIGAELATAADELRRVIATQQEVAS